MNENFRHVATEWAIKKPIDNSIRIARERCPKTALGLACRSRVSDWYGDFSGAHWHGITHRHRNRQTSGISRKQLSSTFDYSLKIRGLDEHASINEKRGFIEFWYC
jgi:hypothetical protein